MTCSTPKKEAYESRSAAMFFARARGLRAYRCPCGKWHLSSKGMDGLRRKGPNDVR